MLTVQLIKSKTLVSLIRISPKFHTMYRNDSRLTSRNQNYDIPVAYISERQVQMNDDRQITAQFNFSRVTGPILIKFAQYVHCVSKKTTVTLHTITSEHINRFW